MYNEFPPLAENVNTRLAACAQQYNDNTYIGIKILKIILLRITNVPRTKDVIILK